MNSGIYKILNRTNGKCYIGSSQNVPLRLKKHKALLNRNKHHSIKLQRAWNKYGEFVFDFIFIHKCSIKECLILEQFYLTELNPSYNIAKNATAPMLGRKQSEEQKQKISIKLKNRKKQPFTKEHKQNLSLSHKGQIPWNKGKFSSEITKHKIRLTRKKHQIRCSNGQIYPSISEAAKCLNIHKQLIWKVLKGHAKHTNKLWFTYVK